MCPAQSTVASPLWDHAADDELVTHANAREVRALIRTRRGEFTEAERLACEAVAITEPTDKWSERGWATATLAEVLDGDGRPDQAQAAMAEALAFFARQGNRAALERTRRRLPHLV